MYKVYENHKRKIAPQYAEHKSFLVWDDTKKRVVYSYFVKADAEKTAELLNEETASLQTKLDEIRDKLLANSEIINKHPKLLGMTAFGKIAALKSILNEIFRLVLRQYSHIEISPLQEETDLSFTAHDAVSDGCQMCGNEWKSLNKQGYCSNCWAIWNS